MADQREFIIYISSTFSDLAEERKAALEVAAVHGKVSQSCRASEQGVVALCTGDVRRCDAYVGIYGLRYGFVPKKTDNPQGKSITELEYDACEPETGSGQRAVPRLLFLKEKGFELQHIDAKRARIDAFRKRVGAGVGQTALPYADLGQFKLELDRALREAAKEFHAEPAGSGGAMGGTRPREDVLRAVVVVGVQGTDDEAVAAGVAAKDPRFGFECVGLNDPRWLAGLDKVVRCAHSACLLVTPMGLKRLAADASVQRVAAALRNAERCGRPLTLVLAGVTPQQLPAGWTGTTHFIAPVTDAWSGPALALMLDKLYDHQCGASWTLPFSDDEATREIELRLQALHCTLGPASKLLLPIVIVAPLRQEMVDLADAKRLAFAGFDEIERPQRVLDFERVAQRLQALDAQWPDKCYFDKRFLWRCFGAAQQPVLRLLLDTIQTINEAKEGSRERRLLQGLRILPRLYRLDDIVKDEYGSADALLDAAEGASLIVVDEFALLDPGLRTAAEKLLNLRRTAVVSVCASDPAHSDTRKLLQKFSYLQVGRLLTRFATDQDPRCEVALNSVERLQRWLRVAVPDLLTLGEKAEAVPELVERSAPLFAPTGGRP